MICSKKHDSCLRSFKWLTCGKQQRHCFLRGLGRVRITKTSPSIVRMTKTYVQIVMICPCGPTHARAPANSLPTKVPRSTNQPSRDVMEMHAPSHLSATISTSNFAWQILWGGTSGDPKRQPSKDKINATFVSMSNERRKR